MRFARISLIFLLTFICRLALAMPIDSGRYFMAADSVKIYYEVKGEGFPVVLIHGFTGNSQGWKRGKLYADLLARGYRVIAMDLPGNGRSDKPHNDRAYADNAEAKDVMKLVSELGIKSYDLVGYSRGSIIVSSLLILDKRVNKAVMGGMGDGYTDPQWPRRIHAYLSIKGDTSFHDVDGMMKYIHSEHFDNESLALQQKWQPTTSPKQLARVRIPVLIIRGTEDKENGSETALQNMIPESKLVYVPGDHNTASSNSQFSVAVLDFFK